jgi:hypothetical protein
MKNHLKIPVIVTMILTMLLFGIPQRTEADPPPYTGEQIFRGLIFGEAPVGGLFPEFWSSDNTLQALSTQEEIDSRDLAFRRYLYCCIGMAALAKQMGHSMACRGSACNPLR